MKIKALLAGITIACALVAAVAANSEQSVERPGIQAVDTSRDSNDLDADHFEGSWGLHEHLSDCISCHGKIDQSMPDESHLVAPVPQLCHSCHEKYDSAGQHLHGPLATGNCLLCHDAHTTNDEALLLEPVPQLCHSCHETKTLRLVPYHTDEMFQQCGNCHEAHSSSNRKLLKRESLVARAPVVAVPDPPEPKFIDTCESLCGLQDIKVVAFIEGSALLKDGGLTEDYVRSQVEQQLQAKGVKIQSQQVESQASLHVRLRMMDVPSQRRPGQVDAISGSLAISLRQTVELPPAPGSDRKRLCTATTWDADAIVIWGRYQLQEGLKQAAGVLAERFSGDYLKANAKNKDLAQAN